MTKRKIIIIGIVICLVIAIGVLGKKMFFEEKEVIKEVQQEFVDVSDANNVDVIDKKLGNEIKITSGYLLSYAIKKSSIWYESKGYVKM